MASSAASGSRPAIQALSGEQQEAVIKARMQVDERTLRRLVKKLTLLLGSTDVESVASSRLSFQAELEAFRLQLARLSAVARTTSEVEIRSYTHELGKIEAEQGATQARIDALKRRLDEVRRERKNKLEYDVVAGEIVKLPTRAELDESLARLGEQLEQVRTERAKYRDMSRDAAARMAEVIRGLEALRNDVGFEVGERERREVARADGDADGDVADAAAAEEASESGRGKRGRKTGDEAEEGEEDDEREEGEQSAAVSRSGSSTPRRPQDDENARGQGSAAGLNASAPPFRPGGAGRGRKADKAAAGSDEEGEVDDGSSAPAAAAGTSSGNTPRKRQRTEEGEVATAGDSEEEEGSIRPGAAAASAAAESDSRARAGTKRRR